jgi:hypothetical protein
VAIGLMAGCIPEARLQPLPEARSLAGDTSAAVAEAHGVRLVADGASWEGYPKNLERRLTPVQVRLENHSGRALRIQYEHFDVEGSTRFHYAAVPPLSLDENSDGSSAGAGTGGAGSPGPSVRCGPTPSTILITIRSTARST